MKKYNILRIACNAIKSPQGAWLVMCIRARNMLNIPFQTTLTRCDIELTTECNLHCHNCNRVCGLAPSEERMTLEQIKKMVDESLATNHKWVSIRIAGGEPTLHPQLFEIIMQLKRLKDMNPICDVSLHTNGYSKASRETLKKVPTWVRIINSQKTSKVHEFVPFNCAPKDYPEFADEKFTTGCFNTMICGIGISRYGYYICGMAAAIDRVFGFDMGAKSLKGFTKEKILEQRQKACPLCGTFIYKKDRKLITEQKISPTWKKALIEYKKNKPRLATF